MHKHPFKVETEGWKELGSFLETKNNKELTLLSLADSYIENGYKHQLEREELYAGPLEQIKGEFIVLPPQITEDLYDANNIEAESIISGSERNNAEFYTGSSFNSPVEIKYDDDLPESEPYHSHNVYEAYVPVRGEIDLGIIPQQTFEVAPQNNKTNDNILATETVQEGEVFVVPPFVQHKLQETYQDPDLAVLRYSEDPTTEIAKFGLDGSCHYEWVDTDNEFRIENYNPEDAIRIEPTEIV